MGGLSGKKVTVVGEFVVKEATAQEMKLVHDLSMVGPQFVMPVAYGKTSYVMNRLRDVDLPVGEYVDFICETLPPLWNMDRVHRVEWNTTRARMIDRFERLRLPGTSSYDLRGGKTHGDPTRENVMRHRTTGALVLIDPLPPRPYAPSMPILDCAKVVQSLLGWDGPPEEPGFIRETLVRLGVRDLEIALTMVDVQLQRIKPYVHNDLGQVQRLARCVGRLKEVRSALL